MDSKSLPPLDPPSVPPLGSRASSRNVKSLPPIKNAHLISDSKPTELSSEDDPASQDALESEKVLSSSPRTRPHSGSQDGLLANAVERRASDAAKPLETVKSPKDTLQLPNSASTKSDPKGSGDNNVKEDDDNQTRRPSMSYSQMSKNEDGDGESEEDENPFEFPDGVLQRVLYFVKVPLLGLLYVTIPDCRKVRLLLLLVLFVNSTDFSLNLSFKTAHIIK